MERDPEIYETCIMCGKVTPVLKTTHIDYRTGYIEGAGQLCYECYTTPPSRNDVFVSEKTILDNSNDADLGRIVRNYYWKSKNQ